MFPRIKRLAAIVYARVPAESTAKGILTSIELFKVGAGAAVAGGSAWTVISALAHAAPGYLPPPLASGLTALMTALPALIQAAVYLEHGLASISAEAGDATPAPIAGPAPTGGALTR